ncbi:MAG: response regulator [Rhodobacteraceae bacterium]|nr:response regulator [Paracoccaceae bacterium]
MGGELTVASRRGEGATFTLEIPFGHGIARPVQDQLPMDVLRPLTVLVVEDHPVNQAVAKGFLTGRGHHPVIAETGEAALDLASKGSFDAVLMDVNLPGISGIEATRRLRQVSGLVALPIIGVSAHAQAADIEACLVADLPRVFSSICD